MSGACNGLVMPSLCALKGSVWSGTRRRAYAARCPGARFPSPASARVFSDSHLALWQARRAGVTVPCRLLRWRQSVHFL